MKMNVKVVETTTKTHLVDIDPAEVVQSLVRERMRQLGLPYFNDTALVGEAHLVHEEECRTSHVSWYKVSTPIPSEHQIEVQALMNLVTLAREAARRVESHNIGRFPPE